MTTGVKIAIGCGVAMILGIMVVAVAVFSGAYWLKGKMEEFTGNENRIEELQKKANATAFDRPADGVIREDRLVKFLDIRKRVFGVYEKHRAALEAMGQKKQGDFGDVTKGFSVINEIRMAQAQALADVGMSEDEYRFMVEQVYKTAWAARSPSVRRQERLRRRDAYTRPRRPWSRRGRHGRARRQRSGEGADESMQGHRELREAADARENAAMDVPPANIALFQKYEAEIKKYAMGGLEWIGL